MSYKAKATNYAIALLMVVFLSPALIWGVFAFLYVLLGMSILGLLIMFWLAVYTIVEMYCERSE